MENKATLVWLASYPRSGNTMLRTILWHCFGLKSASIYPNDLGGNQQLEAYVGHLKHGANGETIFPPNNIPLIKTHEYPHDDQPAIYVVRDGRAATVSLWKFYNQTVPLEVIIAGQHPFGTWSNHIKAWNPSRRSDTLLLKYEEMTTNLPQTLNQISSYLQRNIINDHIPTRTTIAQVDGKVVTPHSNWRADMPAHLLEKFNTLNENCLKVMGYA